MSYYFDEELSAQLESQAVTLQYQKSQSIRFAMQALFGLFFVCCISLFAAPLIAFDLIFTKRYDDVDDGKGLEAHRSTVRLIGLSVFLLWEIVGGALYLCSETYLFVFLGLFVIASYFRLALTRFPKLLRGVFCAQKERGIPQGLFDGFETDYSYAELLTREQQASSQNVWVNTVKIDANIASAQQSRARKLQDKLSVAFHAVFAWSLLLFVPPLVTAYGYRDGWHESCRTGLLFGISACLSITWLLVVGTLTYFGMISAYFMATVLGLAALLFAGSILTEAYRNYRRSA